MIPHIRAASMLPGAKGRQPDLPTVFPSTVPVLPEKPVLTMPRIPKFWPHVRQFFTFEVGGPSLVIAIMLAFLVHLRIKKRKKELVEEPGGAPQVHNFPYESPRNGFHPVAPQNQ
jgi:hypothetical protein